MQTASNPPSDVRVEVEVEDKKLYLYKVGS